MTNDMRVYYNDGEIETFKGLNFDAYDLEGLVIPVLEAIIFDYNEKTICIPMDHIKKIEFHAKEEYGDD